MLYAISKVEVGFRLSFELTVMLLLPVPRNPRVSNVISIGPVPPAGISPFPRVTAVQPHEVLRLDRTNGDAPVFLTVNTCLSTVPSFTGPKS